jgi:hypothetical protein
VAQKNAFHGDQRCCWHQKFRSLVISPWVLEADGVLSRTIEGVARTLSLSQTLAARGGSASASSRACA